MSVGVVVWEMFLLLWGCCVGCFVERLWDVGKLLVFPADAEPLLVCWVASLSTCREEGRWTGYISSPQSAEIPRSSHS